MIQRVIYITLVLLVVQIGLIIALHSGENRLQAISPDTSFADFNPDRISEIRITDEEDKLIITRAEDGWKIPSAYGVNADNNQVEELLDKLVTARKGFAVATSNEAAGRFRTAEDNFEHHLEILAGEAVELDLYLGTSADVRHIYARLAGDQEVYALPISGFEIEPEVDNWFDKNAVKRTRDKIVKLRIGALQLEKSGEDWVLDGEESTELATEAVNDLVDHLANLSVQSVLDPDQVKKLFAEGPELQLSLTEDEGGDINYEFVKADDHFVLKTSDSDVYYKINSWQVEKLKEFTRAKITHSETEENQPDDGSA